MQQRLLMEPHNVKFDLPKQEVMDALEILENRGYADVTHMMGGAGDSGGCYHQLTTYGFEKYLLNYFPGYETSIKDIASCVVNQGMTTNEKISASTQIPMSVIDNTLDIFENRGWCKLSKNLGGRTSIHNVNAELKRAILS